MRINLILLISLTALTSCSSGQLRNPDRNILFVCGGNTGRSPMGESLAKNLFVTPSFSRGINVDSAGSILPEPNAVDVMKEVGLDLSAHRARAVSVQDLEDASLVLVMTKIHEEKLIKLSPIHGSKIHLLSQCADGTQTDVADAFGKPLEFYRGTRNQISHYSKIISKNGWNCR